MLFQKKNGEYTQFKFQPVQVLALGMGGITLVGALLLMLPISSKGYEVTNFLDALFASTSATCVTGLATLDTGTYWSTFGQLVILILMQIGALGFMSFSTLAAIILGKRVGLKERLMVKEAYNVFDMQGMVKLVMYVLAITVIAEVVGALVLFTQFINDFNIKESIYYSIFHSVASFCNSGIDLFGGLNNYIENSVVIITISVLMLCSSLGFIVIIELLRHKRGKKFSLHTKVVLLATVSLTLIGAILFFIFEYSNFNSIGSLPLDKKILASIFESLSPRTGGIVIVDKENLTLQSHYLTIFLMFIGASPGSTGGIKMTNFFILLALVVSVSRGRENVEIFERTINKSLVYKSISITFITTFVLILITMILIITQKGSSIELLYEATSAFCNVGLTIGTTDNLTIFGKIVLIISMYIGKVGPLTLLFAFAYKQRMKKPSMKYPEDKIIVG